MSMYLTDINKAELFDPRIPHLIQERWAARGFATRDAGAIRYAFACDSVIYLTEAQYSSLFAERLIRHHGLCEEHAVEAVAHQRRLFAKCHAERIDPDYVLAHFLERA